MRELNLWDTDFRVLLSEEMTVYLKYKIKNFGGMKKFCNETKLTVDVIYRLLHGKGSGNLNYGKLVEFFSIRNPLDHIIGLTYNGGKYIYPLIKFPDPLLFRIICHIVGDGSITSKNTCRWIQKKENSHVLENLIRNYLGFLPSSASYGTSCNHVTISAFFARLAKHLFDIELSDLKSTIILDKILLMARDYQLQFITAFILDEGHIRYNKATSLIVSQANEEFMFKLSNLLEQLDYEHSGVKEEINKDGNKIYRINIYSQGVFMYYHELKLQVSNLGTFAGLWHKQEQLEKYMKKVNFNPKYSKKQKELINKRINEIFEIQGYIRYSELKIDPILKPLLSHLSCTYLISKFYEKVKSGEVVRVGKGFFLKPSDLNNNFLEKSLCQNRE